MHSPFSDEDVVYLFHNVGIWVLDRATYTWDTSSVTTPQTCTPGPDGVTLVPWTAVKKI